MAQEEAWRGYSLEELRFRRMLNLTKAELEKNALVERFRHMTTKNETSDTRRGIMAKVMGALDYVDYAVLAFAIGKKIFQIFKRRR